MPQFEWDERKNEANVAKHKIDFRDAIEVFDLPHLTVRALHAAEERFVTIGPMQGRLIRVIWTWRDENRRIISAHSARDSERRAYRQGFGL